MNLVHPIAPNNPLHLWTEHSKDQLNWAFRAYKRFVDSLSQDVRERLQQKDHQQEAYVVVFGKTQVGKTTLIMDLMGISEDAMDRVSKVLRGGRPAGKSATATVMEYKRSSNEFWHLKIGDRQFTQLDDVGMTTELEKLREDMEAQRLKVDSPCVVTIPKNYFIVQTENMATVRMLDLPGDSPANPAEQVHVHDMAKKYVPMADLILLLGRGDDLSFLQPNNLPLPGIEDWQSVPSRFRIITTYSFTSQSVRDYVLGDDKDISEKFFQGRLIQEIEKFGKLSNPAKKIELYFPLEFGKSWSAAKNSKNSKDGTREIYERVLPLIKNLKEKLHADINASTTDMARLRNAVDAHVTIAHVKKEKLDNMDKIIEKLKNENKGCIEEWEQANIVIEKKQEGYKLFSDRLKSLTNQQLQKDISDDHFKLNEANILGRPSKTRESFESWIRSSKSSLKEKIKLLRPNSVEENYWFWNSLKINFQENLIDDIDSILDKQFKMLIDRLGQYVIDTYWFTGEDSDYQKDYRLLTYSIQRATKAITEAARKWWLDAAIEYRKNLEKELTSLELEIKKLKHLEDKIWTSIEIKDAEIKERLSERQPFEKQMEIDLKESKRFREILDDEYTKELEHRHNAIAKSKNNSQSFLLLLAAVQLQDVRQKLLHTIKES